MQKQSMPANGQCSKLEETHICELGTWVRAISVLLGALLAPDHWAAQTDLGVAAKVDGIRNKQRMARPLASTVPKRATAN